jgi:hypothetical protein
MRCIEYAKFQRLGSPVLWLQVSSLIPKTLFSFPGCIMQCFFLFPLLAASRGIFSIGRLHGAVFAWHFFRSRARERAGRPGSFSRCSRRLRSVWDQALIKLCPGATTSKYCTRLHNVFLCEISPNARTSFILLSEGVHYCTSMWQLNI